MGHQFPRATAAAALALVLAACGGSSGDADPPPVLDIAREQVHAAPTSDATGAAEAADDDGADEPSAPSELPAADRSTFIGANRVVNLWVGANGDTSTVDVWGRRTFTEGPVLLAESVAFGTASDYFSAPPGHSLVVVGTGAGPDAVELAGILNAADDEQITTVFTNDDDQGSAFTPTIFERGTAESLEPPAADAGLVVLYAANIQSFSQRLTDSLGGAAFYVGDGSTECRVQRHEATGAAPGILGGTQQVELELPPGRAAITLHPWLSADECDQPSVLDIAVDVTAGATTVVLVYSPDGATVAALALAVR